MIIDILNSCGSDAKIDKVDSYSIAVNVKTGKATFKVDIWQDGKSVTLKKKVNINWGKATIRDASRQGVYSSR